jgi:hypothetical protein
VSILLAGSKSRSALCTSCGHSSTASLLPNKDSCLKQIATGRLAVTAESFYAITCPGSFFAPSDVPSLRHLPADGSCGDGQLSVNRCGGILLSDAYAIKQVVPHEFYEVLTPWGTLSMLNNELQQP